MADPIYQYALYFLHAPSGDGWQELITWQGGAASVFDGGTDWAQQRRTFLAQDCQIIGTSRRRIDGVKDSISFLFDAPYAGQFGAADSTGSGATNEPANTIEYEVYTANRRNRRCFYFRGIDDAWIKAGNLTPFGSANLNLVEAYLQWVKNGNGGLRTPANPWLNMTSIQNATTTQGSPLQVNATGLSAQASPQVNNLVLQTKGLKGYPYLNGRWVGAIISNDNVTLGTSSGRYVASLFGTGYIRVTVPTVTQINTWFYARSSNRKTGLPFGVTRGRKSKKVIHR